MYSVPVVAALHLNTVDRDRTRASQKTYTPINAVAHAHRAEIRT